MPQGHGSPIVPSHSLVRPYYACKSRIRYVVLARGGHSEKFVWSMLTISAFHAPLVTQLGLSVQRPQIARSPPRSQTSSIRARRGKLPQQEVAEAEPRPKAPLA